MARLYSTSSSFSKKKRRIFYRKDTKLSKIFSFGKTEIRVNSGLLIRRK